MALPQPARWAMRMVAPPVGMMPRWTSSWAKRQLSAATTMSAASINSSPKVKVMPCTATTMGLVRRRKPGWPKSSGSTQPSGHMRSPRCMDSAMLGKSKPAVKCSPSACSTPTRKPGSSSSRV